VAGDAEHQDPVSLGAVAVNAIGAGWDRRSWAQGGWDDVQHQLPGPRETPPGLHRCRGERSRHGGFPTIAEAEPGAVVPDCRGSWSHSAPEVAAVQSSVAMPGLSRSSVPAPPC
jgi:hypothetical protein